MQLLLTNDDGFDGEGLNVLLNRLSEKHEIIVVAPDRNRSGVSHHFSMSNELKLTKIKKNFYKFEGFPADCVMLATKGVGTFLPKMPDAVVSGINRGANIGTDLIYSGTAAAARQAVLNGIPAVAFSIDSTDNNYYFDLLADFALKNLEKLLSFCDVFPTAIAEKKRCSFVNVNALSTKEPYRGVKITDTSFREYNDSVEMKKISDNESVCRISGGSINSSGIGYTDFEAVSRGYIAVSKVCAEALSYRIVDDFSFSL